MQFKLHDVFFVPALAGSTYAWPGTSGLVLDDKGLHFWNLETREAATVPYGNVHGWFGGPRSPLGSCSWSFTPKQKNEDGRITIFLRHRLTDPPTGVVQIESEAAKAIHNMMCVLYEKYDRRVKTRAAWEIKEDNDAAERKKRGYVGRH